MPVINIPGLKGLNHLPVGISVVTARYRDMHLIRVAREVGKIFRSYDAPTARL